MSVPDDIDALAGEYVLGTLDPGERAAVAARRSREPVLDQAITEWERRLAPLNAAVAPVAPPADLFQRIEKKLADQSGRAPLAAQTMAADLNARLSRWRRIAVAASAIAASLLLALVWREATWRTQDTTYVAVFAKDDVLPSFYLTLDLAKRELTLRPIDARRQPERTYQLWIASDQLGPAPQSLGLVDEDLAPTTKHLTNYDPGLLQKATFGVSLEPRGGSPTGRPTSPALHAKLLPLAK